MLTYTYYRKAFSRRRSMLRKRDVSMRFKCNDIGNKLLSCTHSETSGRSPLTLPCCFFLHLSFNSRNFARHGPRSKLLCYLLTGCLLLLKIILVNQRIDFKFATLTHNILSSSPLSSYCPHPGTFSTLLQHQSVVGPSGPHNLCFPRFQRSCPSVLSLIHI